MTAFLFAGVLIAEEMRQAELTFPGLTATITVRCGGSTAPGRLILGPAREVFIEHLPGPHASWATGVLRALLRRNSTTVSFDRRAAEPKATWARAGQILLPTRVIAGDGSWLQKLLTVEMVSPIGLGGLAALGILANLLGTRLAVGKSAPAQVATGDQPFWNTPLSPRVLSVFSLAVLAVFAVAAALIYYPDQKTVFKAMLAVRAEAEGAVRSGRVLSAQREIRIWDDLIRKLQVGVHLRRWQLNDEQRRAAETLRGELEEVYDALDHGDIAHARQHLSAVADAYQRCRNAYPDR